MFQYEIIDQQMEYFISQSDNRGFAAGVQRFHGGWGHVRVSRQEWGRLRYGTRTGHGQWWEFQDYPQNVIVEMFIWMMENITCLLYTSDAADE